MRYRHGSGLLEVDFDDVLGDVVEGLARGLAHPLPQL